MKFTIHKYYIFLIACLAIVLLFSSCNKVLPYLDGFKYINKSFFNLESIERSQDNFQILKDTVITDKSASLPLSFSQHITKGFAEKQPIYFCKNDELNQPCYVTIVCEEDENGNKNVVITKNTLVKISPVQQGQSFEENSKFSERSKNIAYKIRKQRFTFKLNAEQS